MQPNQLLGERYRLIERIGAGGMGEVWRAEDLMLERVVAVKALHPAMADNADVRQRFLREARTVAALSAPGVVAMYDTAEETAPDGSVLSYLVMEFVVGRPLSEHVDSGDRLPPETVMLLMAQVAQGLDAAHRVGIFHRDVKPTNILVNRSGDATLVDFGIARRAGDTALTTSGAVMGTVEYASPEQLRGEELTPASDVYSLGIVAYECLTGRRPFEGQSVATVIAGHLNRTPPALGQEVAAPIARVVMRALAKDPGDRFDSAAELNRACHDAVRTAASPAANTRMLHEAAVAPPTRQQPIVPPETDEAPPRHRSRWPVLIGTAVALVLVAAIGVIFFTLDLSADSVGDGPSDDPGKSSASDKPEVTKPPKSALVSADNTLCLLSGKRDGAPQAVKARMGLCANADHPEYTFSAVGDRSVAIHFTSKRGNDTIDTCLGVDSKAVKLVADPNCGPQKAWNFTHLRDEDGVAFWRISSGTKDGLCLQGGADKGEAAFVDFCDDSVQQQWRTEVAG